MAAAVPLLGQDVPAAAPTATATPAATPAESKLPPEVEKKFNDLVEKFSKATRKHLDTKSKDDFDALTKGIPLNETQTATLQQAFDAAKDKSVKETTAKISKMWRAFYDQAPAQFIKSLDSAPDEESVFADESESSLPTTSPLEQDLWKSAVDKALTPEQKTAWQKILDTRRPKELDPDAAKFVAAQVDRMTKLAQRSMALITGNYVQNLNLSKERSGQLEELAKIAVEKSAAASAKRVEKQLRELNPEQRQMIKGGNVYIGFEDDEAAEKQSVWTEGLAKLLTDDDRAKLKSIADLRKQHSSRALSRLMLSLLDEKVAFTAAQRQALAPLLEKTVLSSPELVGEQQSSNSYYSINPQTFYKVADKVSHDEVKAILDHSQWDRWRAACDNSGRSSASGDDDSDDTPGADTAAEKKATPPPSLEPEEVERVLSNYLADKAVRQRKEVQSAMTLEADDLARVAALSPELATRLRVAALGATEEVLTLYKANTENTVRSQIADAKPENIRQKLASIQSYYFSDRSSAAPEKRAFWTHIVDKDLSEGQRAAWQKEKDSRRDYRLEAIAGVITAWFDRDVFLSDEQWKKVQEKIVAVMVEYKQELDSYFSSSNRAPWYLQSYTMFIPLAGIPEEEFKAVLDKSQWDRWSESDRFGTATMYWQNVTANHERVKKAGNK